MDGKEGYVVSSVGNYMVRNDSEPEILGADGRTFETMVFYSIADGEFIEADTGRGEINVCGYKEELAANDGHFEMVDKYVKAIQS